MSEPTVPLSIYEKKVEELGKMKEQLKTAGSLSAAVLVRDTLDDFRRTILIPKYLPAAAQGATNIRQGYINFFNDTNNQLGVRMTEQMRDRHITVDEFIDSIMKAYASMNRIIHTCSNAFKTLHSLDDYLIVLKEAPRLSDTEKHCVELVAANIPL